MSVPTTPNYGFKKPDGTEKMTPAQFNYNADIIDAELYKKRVITGTTAPTSATVGIKGQFYFMDNGTNKVLYQCVSVAGSVCTWENKSACITGITAPTTSTVGVVGQFYLDTTSGVTYQCKTVSGATYTWKSLSTMDKIISIVTTANVTQIDFDLTGINLSDYMSLRLEGCYSTTPNNTVGNLPIRINNITATDYWHYADSTSSAFATNYLVSPIASSSQNFGASFIATIMGISGAGALVTSRVINAEVSFYAYNGSQCSISARGSLMLSKATAITSINILTGVANGYIQSGSEFTLYGVRK